MSKFHQIGKSSYFRVNILQNRDKTAILVFCVGHPPNEELNLRQSRQIMKNGKDIFNVHWPNSMGLIETVYEQPWVDLNPWPFAQKATTLTTAPRRPHTKWQSAAMTQKRVLASRHEQCSIFTVTAISSPCFGKCVVCCHGHSEIPVASCVHHDACFLPLSIRFSSIFDLIFSRFGVVLWSCWLALCYR